MKKFIILLAATLLFGACENDDNDAYNNPDITKKAERTVLIYMAANNNLSKLAALDLKEMKEGSKKLDEQQNLIVYVDLPNPMSSYIARIKDGELVDSTFMARHCQRHERRPPALHICRLLQLRLYRIGI